MNALDLALWCTGVATWILLAIVGLVWLLDQCIEWLVEGWFGRKEFMAFVAARLKAKRRTAARDHSQGGEGAG